MTIFPRHVLEEGPRYNETEVRFHIIDPVLRKLGYPGGDDVFIKLEEKIEYPYYHIGHRSKKDMPLGFPDYRAGLKGSRGSFIVEAKAANKGISATDVDQAHSYAAHAQVGANFMVLCDGLEMQVHETLSGPRSEPIISIPLVEMDARFHELENVLSPTQLRKHCQVQYDKSLKICEGLTSSARILGGEYEIDSWAYRVLINGEDQTALLKKSVPQLAEVDATMSLMANELALNISGGFAERDSNGRIISSIVFAGATKNNRVGMQLIGVETMTFATSAKFLSVDRAEPTVFESTADFALSKGTMVPPLFGESVPMGANIRGDIFASARMHNDGGIIRGDYALLADYFVDTPGPDDLKFELDFIGGFSLQVLV